MSLLSRNETDPSHTNPSCPYYDDDKTGIEGHLFKDGSCIRQDSDIGFSLYVGRIAKGTSGDPSMWAVNREPRRLITTGMQVGLISTKSNRLRFKGRIRGRWVLEKNTVVFWLEELNGCKAYLAVPRKWASLGMMDAIRWVLRSPTLPDTIPTLPDSFIGPVRWEDSRSQPIMYNSPPCRCPSPDRRLDSPLYHTASFDSEKDLAAQLGEH